MYKKLISILLTTSMIFSAFAGCAPTGEGPQDVGLDGDGQRGAFCACARRFGRRIDAARHYIRLAAGIAVGLA